MIKAIITWSVHNRVLVILLTLAVSAMGMMALKHTPIDAIPDLSDVQVIVKTAYPGQAPQVVEDQVTYPLTTALMSVPGAKTVRGFSFFGDSFIYVIFDDDTELYWARSRVQEYLSQVAPQLPASAKPQLGPDASGVGWVFIYALIDTKGQHSVADLRSLQDWFLKFELQSISGVSEVASAGGMVKQYQIIVDPIKLRALNIPIAHIKYAISQNNLETGGSVIELAEAEYMIRATGYIKNIEDINHIPLGVKHQGKPLQIQDVASVQIGPQSRRGLVDLDGKGESVGGIVVMRNGENARDVIEKVKDKLESLQKSLPDGVEVVPVYDRTKLIDESVTHLQQKLIAEFLIVAAVCVVFLFHIRSALVAVLSLPVGILLAYLIMYWQGINANIMSLGGIAIAIGAMVDGAIVMVENLHRRLESTKSEPQNSHSTHWQVVIESACEVGPALFFSLLIITVSFLPIFALQSQEGRMFTPLAFTKTYAMAAAALLAITLVPVLMGYCVKGQTIRTTNNPFNQLLVRLYQPALKMCLANPWWLITFTLAGLVLSMWQFSQLDHEFMPDLDEGDLMYMPTTYAGVSIGEAREILQNTNKLIMTVPEVEHAFGKVGRADTATDPAPLTMIETFIQLKSKDQWREGMSTEDLIAELDTRVNFPGLTNAWVMPIKTRIDMLATGIKTPIGIKIGGTDLHVIEDIGKRIETLLSPLVGTVSVYAERVAGARYLTLDIDRYKAAQYGLSIAEIHGYVAMAVGGANVAHSVEGLERYPIQLRFPQSYRNSPMAIESLPIITDKGFVLQLRDVAAVRIERGPAAIKSENARPNGWVYIDVDGVSLSQYIVTASKVLDESLDLPAGYALTWSGQYEYLQRAQERLSIIAPLTLLIIIVLLFVHFKRFTDVAVILTTLPVALCGGVVLLALLDINLSVAVGAGFIALAGVAVETGVIMLSYLHGDHKQSYLSNQAMSPDALLDNVLSAATRRVRPVSMTALSVILGLLPVLSSAGTGAEIMRGIAAPMVGGMVSALVLTLFVIPVIFFLWKRRECAV